LEKVEGVFFCGGLGVVGVLGCVVRIKACLDPTEVDSNGHDPTKKIDRGQRYLQKTKIQGREKRGNQYRKRAYYSDLDTSFRKRGQILLLSKKILNFEQTGATAPYPSQIYGIS